MFGSSESFGALGLLVHLTLSLNSSMCWGVGSGNGAPSSAKRLIIVGIGAKNSFLIYYTNIEDMSLPRGRRANFLGSANIGIRPNR